MSLFNKISSVTKKPFSFEMKRDNSIKKRSLKNIMTMLKNAGYDVKVGIKYVGSGVSSNVFVIDNKYVLKFTNNGHVARQWQPLVNHKNPNVAKCIAVINTFDIMNNVKYIIVQKYYEKSFEHMNFPLIDYSFIDYTSDLINDMDSFDDVWYKLVNAGYTNHGKFQSEYFDEDVRNKENDPEMKLIRKLVKELTNGQHYLLSNGLKPYDIHGDNVRFDSKGTLKIIDF